MNTPKVSILMAQHNRSDYTERCLKSLMNTVFGRGDIELIIVDSGSAENEFHKLKELENMCISCGIKPQIIRLNRNWSIGYNRNLMLKIARGEYVLSMDNDMEFSSGWIEKSVELFNKSGADLLGLFRHPLHAHINDVCEGVDEMNDIPGNCWLTRWIDLYVNVGFFKETPIERFTQEISEDSDFMHRLRDKGYKAYSVTTNLMEHFGAIRSDGIVSAGFPGWKP